MPVLPCRTPALLLSLLPVAAWAQAQPTAPAGAADESILFQEIPSVYGASKYQQKVSEAPSSVTIFTGADIQYYGYRTLADILRAARNFYVTYDRNYNYVGVRGFGPPGDYNSRVLLLVDGHRINDNIYASASIGTKGVIEVDLIDRVEIIRGPASSLYGTGAFFGVINVISKSGRDIDGVQVSAEAGSLETYKARVSAGQKLSNGADLLVSASGFHSAGQKELFEARASYSYQDPEVEATGAALPNSPHDLVKLNVAAPICRQRLTAGLEVQYTGSRLTLAEEPVGGYAITNLTLSTRRWWPRLDLSASVYNLFDRRYFDPGTGNMNQQRIEQDGRVFRAKLTYTF